MAVPRGGDDLTDLRNSTGKGSTDAWARVLACTSYEQINTDILAPLGRALNATSAVFAQFLGLPMRGNSVGHLHYVGLGLGQRAVDEYGEGLYSVDPMVQPALQWLGSDADAPGVGISVLADIEDWRDQADYRRFLERFDISHVLAVAISVRTLLGPQCLCLGFHRSSQQGPFRPEEIDILYGCVPALRPVLSNLAYREATTLASTLLEGVSGSGAGTGFIVVDEDLQVLHANARGLAQLGLAQPRAGSADAESNLLGELRQRLLDPAFRGGSLRSFTLSHFEEEVGRSRSVDVEASAVRWVSGRPVNLLTLSDNGVQREFDAACARYGLSKRECDVARFVCRGFTSRDIACELKITVRTVENHLRSIYAKVQVCSRARLIARLLELN